MSERDNDHEPSTLERQFAKDRLRFLARVRRRYFEELNRPPTKVEFIRMGAISAALTVGTAALTAAVGLVSYRLVGEPLNILVPAALSIAAVAEGTILMKYGPDWVFNINRCIAIK